MIQYAASVDAGATFTTTFTTISCQFLSFLTRSSPPIREPLVIIRYLCYCQTNSVKAQKLEIVLYVHRLTEPQSCKI